VSSNHATNANVLLTNMTNGWRASSHVLESVAMPNQPRKRSNAFHSTHTYLKCLRRCFCFS
jgi:hypothetical protein